MNVQYIVKLEVLNKKIMTLAGFELQQLQRSAVAAELWVTMEEFSLHHGFQWAVADKQKYLRVCNKLCKIIRWQGFYFKYESC